MKGLSKKRIFAVIAVITFINAPNAFAQDAEPKELSCSSLQAVYRPHPKYARRDGLDFALTISVDEMVHATNRGPLFSFRATDKQSGEDVSTMRLALTESQGSATPALNAYWGQFAPIDSLEDMKPSLSFDVVALNRDFSQSTAIVDSERAPYALVFPNTYVNLLKKAVNASEHWDKYIRFHTPARVFPDFAGYDVWILSECPGGGQR